MPMDKRGVAAALTEIGDLLELAGEDPFRSRSYRAAARVVDGHPGNFSPSTSTEELEKLKGVGPALAEKISQLLRTGELAYLNELRSRVPEGVREMLKISGLGPRKVRTLYEKLNVMTVGELEYACKENRLVELPGFGLRSQENILRGIEKLKRFAGRFLLPPALGLAGEMTDRLAGIHDVGRVAVVGALRRWRETVRGVELLVEIGGGAPGADRHRKSTPGDHMIISAIMSALKGLPFVTEVKRGRPGSRAGAQALLALTELGIPVALTMVTEEAYSLALLLRTGSREHLAGLAARAEEIGYRLTEAGFYRGTEPVPVGEEEDIYRTLGLAPVPPEMREGRGEIEVAAVGEITELVTADDLCGLLHVHSDYSDGMLPLREMARAAADRGYTYLGLADHSRAASYAGGLSIERVKEQQEEIRRLNEGGPPLPILSGIESDILADGSLDYPEEVLGSFDFVIASVHSRFSMSREEMTARVVRAVENPHTNILGHPTGRLLLARDPYEIDMEEVIKACAREGVVIELNASPHRLDIDWREIPRAREAGIPIAINPDAHRAEGIDDVTYGVAIARKGGLTAADVINTRNVDEAREFFRARRSRG